MKRILIFLCSVLFFIGCYDNETIHADYVEYWSNYDTTSSDPVWKYVSQYYYKYGKVINLNPDVKDYVFNFQMKNEVRMVNIVQEQEEMLKGLKFVEQLFLNSYSDYAKREVFPYSIILADSIYDLRNKEYVDMYTATDYVAFAVNNGILDKNETEKVELSMKWNTTFLKYCIAKMGWEAPDEFYLFSSDEEFYANWFRETDEVWTQENFYELGYVKGEARTIYWPEYKKGYGFCSSKSSYFEEILNFLLTTPAEEIERIVAAHSKIANAHDVLDQAFKDAFGIDYRTMVYKPKE